MTGRMELHIPGVPGTFVLDDEHPRLWLKHADGGIVATTERPADWETWRYIDMSGEHGEDFVSRYYNPRLVGPE